VKKKTILTLGIILIAFNLRPALTALGPLVSLIRTDMGLSNSVIGLITTLPLITFAVLSPIIPSIAYRWGNEVTLFLGIILLMMGILIRSVDVLVIIFTGTVLIGIGIAFCNVLLPALIKEEFPSRVGLMTSVYSTAMTIFAAIGSGISIPLAVGLNLGWQRALACWAILAGAAIVVWLPQLRKRGGKPIEKEKTERNKKLKGRPPELKLWRSSLAWQVTFFMGLQSLSFYIIVAWLPEILHSYGVDISLAGWLLFIMQFAGIPATFVVPLLAERFHNQQKIVIVIGLLYLVGLGGLIVYRDIVMLTTCIVLLGLGQGACISLIFTLFVLRTTNAQQAAALSGMAQSIGYLLAAIGPTVIGWMFDLTHSWVTPILSLMVISVLITIVGIGAGRNLYVLPRKNPPLEE